MTTSSTTKDTFCGNRIPFNPPHVVFLTCRTGWQTISYNLWRQDSLILISSRKVLNNAPLPSEICLNGIKIKLSQTVRKLGVTFDQTLSLQHHISNICRICYLELCRISAICHYLATDAIKTLICTFIQSRLDYCNALLSGSPKHLPDRLQKVQNNAARLIYQPTKLNHATSLLCTLHWLPVEKKIFKLTSLFFKSLNGSAPIYLSDLLYLYTLSRQLCSSTDTQVFRIPSFAQSQVVSALSLTKLQQHGKKLPAFIRHASLVPSGLPWKPFSSQKLLLQPPPLPRDASVCQGVCLCAGVGGGGECRCTW